MTEESGFYMNTIDVINRVFTKKVITDLVMNGQNDIYATVVRRYINEPENKQHGEIISEIYECLAKTKRNEYFYQNTLLNKLLVGKHSVNTTTALSQLRIARSIADFVLINGNAIVYEIKSECDNYDRLRMQIEDYYKAFSYVCVATAAHNFEKIQLVLSSYGDIGRYVGIYTLTDSDTMSRKLSRSPLQNDNYLEHDAIFKLLRKREYENVIISYFGELPQSDPVFHFRTCINKFSKIPIAKAQELATKELKKRNKISKTDFERVPDELKSVIYFSNMSNDIEQLTHVLGSSYRG